MSMLSLAQAREEEQWRLLWLERVTLSFSSKQAKIGVTNLLNSFQRCFSGQAAEGLDSSWQFFVHHYRNNETQAYRDPHYTYLMSNGSYHIGPNPPEGAEPLGIVYPRGVTWDYIAEVTGDNSFEAAAMREYFMKAEKCNYLPQGTPGHGFDGFITLSRNNVTYLTGSAGVVDQLSKASLEVEGIEANSTDALADLLLRDPYPPGEYSEGIFMLVSAVTETKRRSGARTYVVDTLNAKNTDGSKKYPLTLSTRSLATKVLFDQQGEVPRAYGVEYMNRARLKEVIVSGGSFNTPQILKLSGVGPREELEKFDIPVVADVPAVDNYEATVIGDAAIDWDNYSENCTFDFGASDPCYQEWLLSGTGPYGEAAAPLSLVYRSSVSDNEHPDLWLYGAPGAAVTGFYPGFSRPAASPASFSWALAQMPGPGSDARGVSRCALVEAGELALNLFNQTSETWAPITIVSPGPGEDLRQSLKDEAFGHHATGSCRMGPKGDRDACTDSQFRVQGVEGLRVADASVFPRAPGAWPTMPTYMIGLKLADILSREASS
uniref:Glucose-methanol-choline oxidoreductase N-terminal domain-containing protein n=1 Tax=Bionectria ochroleuca TaxID=29856 RepID=A0A8H7NEH6_BIOOC